jgi:hypothetical protein
VTSRAAAEPRSSARSGVGRQARQRGGQRPRVARGDEQAGDAVADDLGQAAVGGGDDGQPGRGRLERRAGQRIGLGARHGGGVGRGEHRADVGAEAEEPHAIGDPEAGGELAQLALAALLARPRGAGDEGERAALGQRRLGERAQEHVLALPRRQPPDDRHREPVGRHPERARAWSRGTRPGTCPSPSGSVRTVARRRTAASAAGNWAAVASLTHGRASAVSSRRRYAGHQRSKPA